MPPPKPLTPPPKPSAPPLPLPPGATYVIQPVVEVDFTFVIAAARAELIEMKEAFITKLLDSIDGCDPTTCHVTISDADGNALRRLRRLDATFEVHAELLIIGHTSSDSRLAEAAERFGRDSSTPSLLSSSVGVNITQADAQAQPPTEKAVATFLSPPSSPLAIEGDLGTVECVAVALVALVFLCFASCAWCPGLFPSRSTSSSSTKGPKPGRGVPKEQAGERLVDTGRLTSFSRGV